MIEASLEEFIRMFAGSDQYNEGMVRVVWIEDRLFSENLRRALRMLDALPAPPRGLARSRKAPYSRVLHARVERASDLRALVEEKLAFADCHRVHLALDALRLFFQRGEPNYGEMLERMRREPSLKRGVILGMKLIEPRAEPFYQRKEKRR